MYCIDSIEEKSSLGLFKQDRKALAYMKERIKVVPHRMEGPGAALPLSSMLVSAWASSHILCSCSRKAGHGQPQINYHPPKKENMSFSGSLFRPLEGLHCASLASGHPCGQRGKSLFRKREMGVGRTCWETKGKRPFCPQVSCFCPSLHFGLKDNPK